MIGADSSDVIVIFILDPEPSLCSKSNVYEDKVSIKTKGGSTRAQGKR